MSIKRSFLDARGQRHVLKSRLGPWIAFHILRLGSAPKLVGGREPIGGYFDAKRLCSLEVVAAQTQHRSGG